MRDMYLTRRAVMRASGTYHSFAQLSLGADPSTRGDADLQELEDLLEVYFARVDHALNSLTSLSGFVQRSEEFTNTELDSARNNLIQVDLLTSVSTLVLSMYTLVTGIFGMNLSAWDLWQWDLARHLVAAPPLLPARAACGCAHAAAG